MTTNKGICVAAALLAAGTVPTAASAVVTVVNSLPGGTAITLPAANLKTQGPVSYGTMTFTSDAEGGSLFGWTGGYAYGNGTVAAGGAPIIALDKGANANIYNYVTMSLSFADPIKGFLAYLNWTDGSSYNSVSIGAYDASDNLIAFYQINNNGYGGRPPGYYGFLSDSYEIARVGFFNGYIGASDLSYIGAPLVATGAVPEPASWALMVAGFGLLGGAMRRRGGVVIA